jgi:flagellar biosynthesis component FlhA
VELMVPIWFLTSFEVKHIKRSQLFKIATDSLSSIETADEANEVLSVIMDTLKHLKGKGIMHLDEALVDEVLPSKDLSAIVSSVSENLQSQSDSDKVLMEKRSKLERYIIKDEDSK